MEILYVNHKKVTLKYSFSKKPLPASALIRMGIAPASRVSEVYRVEETFSLLQWTDSHLLGGWEVPWGRSTWCRICVVFVSCSNWTCAARKHWEWYTEKTQFNWKSRYRWIQVDDVSEVDKTVSFTNKRIRVMKKPSVKIKPNFTRYYKSEANNFKNSNFIR